MPRYIDAHRAENLLRMCGSYHGVISFDTVIDVLHDTQTADVVERKKGRWVDETFEFEPWWVVHHPYKCNQCGERSEEDSNFCPNCGADMRGAE